ncbi:MAG: type II toxin-antitoxin system VapC family toxin, partial [Ferruginibacter sp.]
FLIDTNVIIDYTSNLMPGNGTAFVENIFNTAFNTSVIVKIEVLGYNDAPVKIKLLEEFLASATIFPPDDAVTQKTIELRRIKKMKLGDAIIAATALVYNLTLITRNTNDFKNIDGLIIVNPHAL